jgi:hypothetical protein
MKSLALPLTVFVLGAFVFPPISKAIAGNYWLLLTAAMIGITVWAWKKVASNISKK